MENLEIQKDKNIAKMISKDKKDTYYYFMSFISIVLIPITLYITY